MKTTTWSHLKEKYRSIPQNTYLSKDREGLMQQFIGHVWSKIFNFHTRCNRGIADLHWAVPDHLSLQFCFGFLCIGLVILAEGKHTQILNFNHHNHWYSLIIQTLLPQISCRQNTSLTKLIKAYAPSLLKYTCPSSPYLENNSLSSS